MTEEVNTDDLVLEDSASLDQMPDQPPDIETDEMLKMATARIKTLLIKQKKACVEIGMNLKEVKAKLGHGRYLKWLETEFKLTDRTARYYVQAPTDLATNRKSFPNWA